MKLTLILLMLFTLLSGDTLNIAFGSHNTAPFVFLDSTAAVSGGIFEDIAIALCERTGMDYKFVNIPRKRLEEKMISGEVDLYFKMNPRWATDSTLFIWSEPLFWEQDILLSRRDRPFQMSDSLSGITIGTILGFYYPSLEEIFDSGELVRKDAHSLHSNIGKLELERIDALVDSEILIRYQLKVRGSSLFYISKTPVDRHRVHAMISAEMDSRNTILTVLDELQQEGVIDTILLNYQ